MTAAASISTTVAPAATHESCTSVARVIEEVGRHRRDRRGSGGAGERVDHGGIRRHAAIRAERPARAVGRQRGLDRQERAEVHSVDERAAGPDANEEPRAQPDQLLDDDRRARAAHPRRLDREQPAVARAARVAPQAAMVVEHQRLFQQRLGHVQRPVGVARQQNALGQLRRRAQMDRRPRHPTTIWDTAPSRWRSGAPPPRSSPTPSETRWSGRFRPRSAAPRTRVTARATPSTSSSAAPSRRRARSESACAMRSATSRSAGRPRRRT